MKNVTLFAIRNKKRYNKLYNLILETFVVNKNLYIDTIEFYEENKLFEIISFLRKELIA
jgi:cytidylate kinase